MLTHALNSNEPLPVHAACMPVHIKALAMSIAEHLKLTIHGYCKSQLAACVLDASKTQRICSQLVPHLSFRRQQMKTSPENVHNLPSMSHVLWALGCVRQLPLMQ